MSLSKRLKAICDCLDKNDVISDIGTVHGLVPIYHIIHNKANKAYACDINPLPLSQAKENINLYNVNVETILSNGIENIKDDSNTLVIAGMGNNTIIEILTSNNAKLKNINKIVVQSNTHPETIRLLLNKMGYKVVNERVVFDKNKYYEIDCFILGNEELTDLEIKYGKINLLNREETFINKLKFDYMVKSKIYEKSKDINFLNDLNEIKEILK